MNLKQHISRFATLLLGALALSSCDSVIYDYEGDCSYKVRFEYTYNMSFADAFAHEVKTLTLYLVDQNGNVVKTQTESGDVLATPGYCMTLDAPAGIYDIIVWAGTDELGSFPKPDATKASELKCMLQRKHSDDGKAYFDTDMDDLFHGYIDNVEFPADDAAELTVPLVKNTNAVILTLQNVDGVSMRPDQFTVKITDDNGYMDWDNTLIPHEDITYYAWHYASTVIESGKKEDEPLGRAVYSGVMSEIAFPQMSLEHSPMIRVINNDNGEEVLTLPLNDFSLIREQEFASMPDQEFLDRADSFKATAFLDKDMKWVYMTLNILSWQVVIQNTSL